MDCYSALRLPSKNYVQFVCFTIFPVNVALVSGCRCNRQIAPLTEGEISMSSTTGLLDHTGAPAPTALKDRILPALLAMVIGCTVIFAMGFTETPALHNAAHDGRHSAGFPCH